MGYGIDNNSAKPLGSLLNTLQEANCMSEALCLQRSAGLLRRPAAHPNRSYRCSTVWVFARNSDDFFSSGSLLLLLLALSLSLSSPRLFTFGNVLSWRAGYGNTEVTSRQIWAALGMDSTAAAFSSFTNSEGLARLFLQKRNFKTTAGCM